MQVKQEMQADQHFTFDRYYVDLANAQLWRQQQVIPLTAKAFAVLRHLIKHAGQLATKAELFATVWSGTVVSDGALTFCIVELRKALGDNAKSPRFIETVHGRGYRFIAQVVSSQHPVISSSKSEPIPSTRHSIPFLVGREAELSQLDAWWDKALSGERQIVLVTGEPGIGKTTLVETFLSKIMQRGMSKGEEENQKATREHHALTPNTLDLPPWISWGQCIEHYGPGEPYMPILEALGRLCRQPGGKQVVSLLGQHASTWLVQMPSLLNVTELEVLQHRTAGATRERMLREMGEALEAITAERPLVLWLEDLHWSDASTVELLSVLARRRESARLLMIGSYRPVDVIVQQHPLRMTKQELQLHGLCTELSLGLLSEAQVAEYLTARLSTRPPLPILFPQGEWKPYYEAVVQKLARAILHRTDGNPLFMVTVVEDLVSQSVQEAEDQGEISSQFSLLNHRVQTEIPATLQQLIAQHIERLSLEDQRMLEVASVIGMEFSAAAVAAGLAIEVEAVEERCEEFARHGRFLRASGVADWPDGAITARYSFLHALYQEALYNRIPARRRQRLHQQIARQQESAYGEQAREIATELAVHFEQGRDSRKAVHYLRLAGENAVERSAYRDAISLLTRGLELLDALPDTPERTQQELSLHLTLAMPLQATRGYSSPEVQATYSRAQELCRQLGETRQLFLVLFGLRLLHQVRGELSTARTLGEQLLDLAQKERDPALLMEADRALGNTCFHLGEFGVAQTHLTRSLTLYDAQRSRSQARLYGGLEPGVIGLSMGALVLWHLGYPDQALRKSEAARALAQELSRPFSIAVTRAFGAMLHQLCRESSLTQEWAEAAIILAHEHGFPPWLGQAAVLQGWALAEKERVAEGIAQIYQGLAADYAVGIRQFHSYLLALLTEAYGKAGQVEEGLSALAEALAVIDKTGERFYEAELYRLKGELTLQQANQKSKGKRQKAKGTRGWGLGTGSFSPQAPSLKPQAPSGAEREAEECFLKAIEIARKQQAKSLELRVTVSLARLWRQQGKRHEAHSLLAEIYGWFTEGFDTKDLREARALLDSLASSI